MRRRNLIQPDQFPYVLGVAWQDGNTAVYDSGNYPALLEECLRRLGPRPPGVRESVEPEGCPGAAGASPLAAKLAIPSVMCVLSGKGLVREP